MLASLASLAVALGIGGVASADQPTSVGLVSTGSHSGGCGFLLCGSTYVGSSSDGTKVFFLSDEQLTADDQDNLIDVFQRSGGATTLMSPGNDPAASIGIINAAVTADGSHVFFETDERLVAQDTDAFFDVYERTGGATNLISRGASFNGAFDAALAGFSASGNDAFFTTDEKIGDGDTDAYSDIYRNTGGVTTRVSKGESVAGNGAIDAFLEKVSDDGSHVFFSTTEGLTADDTDSSRIDVFDRTNGHVKLVSRTNGATGTDNGAFDASFGGATPDGTSAFVETKEKLATADTDSSLDVFRRIADTTILASTGPTNPNGANDNTYRGTSNDGNRVFFDTTGKLISGDTDTRIDIYQRDLGASPATQIVSTGSGSGSNAITPVFLAATGDGARVFFAAADAFTADDLDTTLDIFERANNATTLVSAGTGPAANFDVCLPPVCGFQVTAGGTRVFFQTVEPLTADDLDANLDVYQRAFGVTSLLTGTGQYDVALSGASADGTRVFFETQDSLVDADSDGVYDVYEAAPPGTPPIVPPVVTTPDTPQTPTGTGNNQAPPVTVVAPGKSLTVKISRNRTQHVLRNRGVTIRVRCDIDCSATAGATVTLSGVSRVTHLANAKRHLAAGTRKTLKLRLGPKAKRAIRRTLRHRKSVRVVIGVTVRGGGAASSQRLSVRAIR